MFRAFVKPQPVTTSTRTESGRRPQKGVLRRIIPYVIGAVLVAAIVYGFMPKPLDVETAAVSVGPLTVSVLEEGKTRIRHRHIVSAPVAGFLQRVSLRAGAPIEKGKTVLATIQPQPASFLDPRAQAEAEAHLIGTEAGKSRAQAELERVQEALGMAERDLVRTEELHRKGAVSKKEFETAENQAAMLARDLRAANSALDIAESERIHAAAALQQTQNPADVKAEPLVVLAPVNGFVLNVTEESARTIAPGMPIMEVGDPIDLECEIELLSTDAVAVQPGAEVSIEQWGGERPLRGKVALIEPGGYTKISALGVEEQRVKVRVNFAEPIPPEHPLGDRSRVEARIITWHSDRVLQIPTGAIFRRGGDWMTFIAEGGKARLTKVDIVHNNGVAAEVRAGVSEGQRVLLHPPDTVADGVAVKARTDSKK
jgi:HlyD family secretion protein